MPKKKQEITEESYNSYAQTYSKFGTALVDLPINNSLPNVVAGLLPSNYRAADLGSNDGIFAQQTIRLCEGLGKKGQFWSIDPYPTHPTVVKMTSEQFVSNPAHCDLDIILCKYSIHFNQNQREFFQNVHQKLKDSGKFIILQVGSNFELPWTEKLQNKFKQLYIKAADIIPSDLFTYELESQQKEIEIEKQFFKEFIKRRGWSNLLSNTEEEIEQCLTKIDERQENQLHAKTYVFKYTLTKKSKISE